MEEEEEEEDVDVAEEIKRREKEEKKKKKKKTMTSEGKTPEDWSQLSPDELARRIMAEDRRSRSNDEESEEDFDFDDVSFVDDDDDDDDNDEDDNEKETIDAFESLFFEDEDKEIDEDYELEMAALKKMNRLKRKPPAIVCARCFSLRNTGRPKNANAEILLVS